MEAAWGDRLTGMAAFLLSMALPILVLFGVRMNLLHEQERAGARQLESRLDREQRLLMFGTVPREKLVRHFLGLFSRLERRGFSPGPGNAQLTLLPGYFEYWVAAFDSSGKLWIPPGGKLESKYLFDKLWKDLQKGFASEQNNRLYRTIFGKRFYFWDLPGSEGLPVEVASRDQEGMVLWKRGKGKSGLVVFSLRPPDPLTNLADSISKASGTGIWAAVDPGTRRRFIASGGRGKPFRKPVRWLLWREVMERSRLQGGGTFLANGHLCRLVRHPDGVWVMRAIPSAGVDTSEKRFQATILACFALLLVSTIWLATGWTPLSSLRLNPRLLTLFTLAVLVPGALLLALGFGWFSQRARILEAEVHTADVARLRQIDGTFRTRQESLLSSFRRINALPVIRRGLASETCKIANTLMSKRLLAHLETRTIDSAIVGRNNGDPLLDEFVRYLAVVIMHRLIGGPKPDTHGSLVDAMIFGMADSSRLGFAGVQDQPDSLIPLNIGRESTKWYWDVHQPSPLEPIAFFMVAQSVPWDLEVFLESSIPPGCFAYQQSRRRWFPSVPPMPGFEGVIAGAMMGRQSEWRRASSDGKPFLMTAYPSVSIPGICYLTWTDMSGSKQHLETLRGVFGGAVLLLLLVALLVARQVARSLMAPIREISAGIAAMDRRVLSYRIPDLGGDEFGRLGRAFNELMEERRDLDLAREVQQRILPAKLPSIPGYQVAFACRSMTELGGDYCDVLPLPDGKFLILILDVTGHGISSALLTTMAKTTTVISARQGDDIGGLFLRLNQMVNQVVQKKKLMTVAAMILDPASHLLTWSCAGHPAPKVRRASGELLDLKMAAYPIGTRKKMEWKTQTFSFGAGDAVVLYTDGLIEAMNPLGEMFSYEGLADSVGRLAGGDAEKTIEGLLRENDRFRAGVPENDDLTLLVLRRLPVPIS